MVDTKSVVPGVEGEPGMLKVVTNGPDAETEPGQPQRLPQQRSGTMSAGRAPRARRIPNSLSISCVDMRIYIAPLRSAGEKGFLD